MDFKKLKEIFEGFKKGSLSTRQIVLLIILIAGFIVILVFISQLNLGENSKEQLCRNSVMQASSTISESGSSLQCKTKYVCLTADGSCDEMASPDETVEVESKEEIFNQLSEQKASCWWMFGEGQVKYIGDGFTQNNYCSICHQTHLDDSLGSIESVESSLSKDELYDYMTENNYSESQTYSQYIFRTNDLDSLKQRVVQHEDVDAEEVSFGDMALGEMHFNVMGITNDVGDTYFWTGVAAGVVGVATLPITGAAYTVAGVALITSGTSGILGGDEIAGVITSPEIGAITVEGRGIENQFMAPTFQEANSDKFKALNCQDVLTKS